MSSHERALDHWKPLLVCPGGDMSRRIGQAFAELGMHGVAPVTDYPRMGTIVAMAAERGANICFLDAATNPEHALLLIGEISPSMPAVAVHPRMDADLILRALRRGATEFLAEPEAEQVRGILSRLGAKRVQTEGTARLGKVIGVIPAKPGSGASTLAVQLASELKRRRAGRVLLADLDAGCNSVAFQLKLKSDFHMGDALRDAARLDDDLWGRLTVGWEGGDALLAPADPMRDLTVTPAQAAELAAFLRPRYDFAVFDLPNAEIASTSGCAMLAQELILVSSNELAVLHAARRTIDYLASQGVERKRLRLVLSRYSARAGLKREDVRSALGLEPSAVLGADGVAVQNAILEGRPVARSTTYGRAVEQLARGFQDCAQAVGNKPTRGWLGSWGRGH